MSNFYSTINLEGTEIPLLSCEFGASQATSENGLPREVPLYGGIFYLKIESSNDTEIFRWAVSPTMKKSGNITF